VSDSEDADQPGLVLVTGATGYVGRRLVPHLLDRGVRVRALTRDPGAVNWPDGVETVRGDVTDPGSLPPALEGVDVVVHLAAVTADRKPPPGGYDAVNADGTAALARAAASAGVRGFVLMGGIDTSTGTPGPYLAGRRSGQAAVRESGVPWALLQPSIMFGGGDAAFVVAMRNLVRRAPVVPVPGDGRVRLQLIHVDDVCACLGQLAAAGSLGGRAYAIGGAEILTYDEVLDVVGEALGKKRVRKLHLPTALLAVQARLMQVLPRPPVTPAALELFASDNVAEPNTIRDVFGVEPKGFAAYVRAHGLTG
jgi:NADH dehydrogenase